MDHLEGNTLSISTEKKEYACQTVLGSAAVDGCAGKHLRIARSIDYSLGEDHAAPGFVFNDDALAALPAYERGGKERIIQHGHVLIEELLLKRECERRAVEARLIALFALPIGDIVAVGIFDAVVQQLLGDAAYDLTAITIVQRQVDHDVTGCSKPAENVI